MSKFTSVKDMFALDGRKAIVTGSGSGIGNAIALGLSEYNVDLALIGRTAEKLKRVRKEIEERFPVRVLDLPTDVSNATQVNEAVNQVIDTFGRIDILVNSHGVAQWGKAEEMTEKDWDTTIDINLKGVFLMCQAASHNMIKNKGGKIINIASTSAQIVDTPQPQAHYNTSKAGVVMLTKCLAYEWAKYNINVNCISPGYTLTPMVVDLLKSEPQYKDYWRNLVPLDRFAEPIEMVGAAIFLASDASSYVTGHDLVVDGGYTTW
ncbi:SDR family NAD(P)-dependent oxidoreductase [[Eubacterium] cellulosolvens]